MRKAGDVCFAEVSRDSEGLIHVFHSLIRIAIFFYFLFCSKQFRCSTLSLKSGLLVKVY